MLKAIDHCSTANHLKTNETDISCFENPTCYRGWTFNKFDVLWFLYRLYMFCTFICLSLTRDLSKSLVHVFARISIRLANPKSNDDVCYKQVAPLVKPDALIQFVRRLYGTAAHPPVNDTSYKYSCTHSRWLKGYKRQTLIREYSLVRGGSRDFTKSLLL